MITTVTNYYVSLIYLGRIRLIEHPAPRHLFWAARGRWSPNDFLSGVMVHPIKSIVVIGDCT